MNSTPTVCSTSVPRHVAIIMDGNGRWAESRGLERNYGHIQGVESIRKALDAAVRHGVKYLSVYAFSTENWARPIQEVNKLMELLTQSIMGECPKMVEEGIRVMFIGNTAQLSAEVREAISISEQRTQHCDKITIVIAVNYSSRWEITEAAKRVMADVEAGLLSKDDITDKDISDRLTTAGIPDPDILIRTSGELRLSNFMLWQLSYSELYFVDEYWPDFGEESFDKAMAEYSKRKRRYGAL